MQPDGGPVNPKGVDFYSRLVDELLEAGIKPWLTLYHWDLPQALEERGGWANRDTAYLFRDYALHMHDALGDRVDVWTTLNEPWCSSFLCYTGGAHAPGRQDVAAGLAAGHHLLLAHGLAVQALRERDPELELGITLNLTVAKPVDPTHPGDVDAARRIDGQFNRFFLDPIFRGHYAGRPDRRCRRTSASRDVVQPGDLEVISTPIDTLGVNYYHGEYVSDRPAEQPLLAQAPTDRPTRSPFPAADGVYNHPQGLPLTAMEWEVQPDGLRELLVRVHRGLRGIRRRSPLRHRERCRLRRRRRRGRRGARRRAHGVPRGAPRRHPRRDRRGRARARLLLLVAHGQLRVGVGLRQALRHSCASTTTRRSAR